MVAHQQCLFSCEVQTATKLCATKVQQIFFTRILACGELDPNS